MEKIDVRYVAGLFDGEGSAGIYPQKDCFKYSCTLGQADIGDNSPILNELCNYYGGKVFPSPNRRPKKSKKNMYVWYLNKGDEALQFLKEIYPHLRIKQREVDLTIKFIELCGEQREGKKRPRKLKKQQRLDRFDLYTQFLDVRDGQNGGIAGIRNE